VGQEKTSILVITAATTVAREQPITAQEMNRKVAVLQQALRDRTTDPRPAAQDIYNTLFRPIEADLRQAGADTLVWSLEGVLRYVPLAALYDGKQYIVEKYNTVTVNPVSLPRLKEKPDLGRLSVAAMGISQKLELALPGLPAVKSELDQIVRDVKVKDANGVLPGTLLLDGQFTEKAMENQLNGEHAVVHIASHFVFNPGDDSQSYLLLAGKDEGVGGFHLTVADFNSNPKLKFRKTDLLTLSACETGMSGNASDGREVDGLGTTAQLKGARAVISSLWEVNDTSTGALMADFYRRWAAGAGRVNKAEALRQAQLDLLQGRRNRHGADVDSGRGSALVPTGQITPVGFSHPYYWAPFVLMGNWR
jgi:CHAT domain-containing protein